MAFRSSRTTLGRLLVAALALWLPMATGSGGDAACRATSTLATTLVSASPAHGHLPCHEEGAAAAHKTCCCKSGPALRATRCGCHDGDPSAAGGIGDPMLAGNATGLGMRVVGRKGDANRDEAVQARSLEAPDPPPPRVSPSDSI
jgi:hypothetical protein